jgi:hypothetical protein
MVVVVVVGIGRHDENLGEMKARRKKAGTPAVSPRRRVRHEALGARRELIASCTDALQLARGVESSSLE